MLAVYQIDEKISLMARATYYKGTIPATEQAIKDGMFIVEFSDAVETVDDIGAPQLEFTATVTEGWVGVGTVVKIHYSLLPEKFQRLQDLIAVLGISTKTELADGRGRERLSINLPDIVGKSVRYTYLANHPNKWIRVEAV